MIGRGIIPLPFHSFASRDCSSVRPIRIIRVKPCIAPGQLPSSDFGKPGEAAAPVWICVHPSSVPIQSGRRWMNADERSYAQNNAVKGRTFESLTEQNTHLADWEKNVADTRIHGTTRRQVGKVFEEVERPALQPLPASLCAVFEEGLR